MTSSLIDKRKSVRRHRERRKRYGMTSKAGRDELELLNKMDDFTRYCLTGWHRDLKVGVRCLEPPSGTVDARGFGPIEKYLIKLAR